MIKRLGMLFSVAAAGILSAAAGQSSAAVNGLQQSSRTCHSGYVHATFPWGERCLRSGQYCKKVRNPLYHKYNFQCVDGKLRLQKAPKPKGK